MKKSDSPDLAKKGYEQEAARQLYWSLIKEHSPVRDLLDEVSASEVDLRHIFDNLVERVDIYDWRAYCQPSYTAKRLEQGKPVTFSEKDCLSTAAIKMLNGNQKIDSVVKMTQDVSQQDADVEYSTGLMNEVQQALSVSNRSVGTFNRGRRSLTGVRNDSLALQHALLDAELAFINDRLDSGFARKLRALEDQKELLHERALQLRAEGREDSAVLEERDSQRAGIERETAEIERLMQETETDLVALQRRLEQRRNEMSEQEVAQTEIALKELEGEVQQQREALSALRVQADQLKIRSTVVSEGADKSDRQREYLVRDYDELRGKVRSLHSEVTGTEARQMFSAINGMWVEAVKLDARAQSIRTVLERIEGDTLAMLESELEREEKALASIRVDLKAADWMSECAPEEEYSCRMALA